MELRNSDLVYIFNCVSEHVARVEDSLNDAKDYISKDLGAFIDLKSRIDLMIKDIESGTTLMAQWIEELEDLDGYEEVWLKVSQKQEAIQAVKDMFQKAIDSLDDDEDE
jgi:hypothetical protein